MGTMVGTMLATLNLKKGIKMNLNIGKTIEISLEINNEPVVIKAKISSVLKGGAKKEPAKYSTVSSAEIKHINSMMDATDTVGDGYINITAMNQRLPHYISGKTLGTIAIDYGLTERFRMKIGTQDNHQIRFDPSITTKQKVVTSIREKIKAAK